MIWLLACTVEPDAVLYDRASEPATPFKHAIESCLALQSGAESCVSEVVANRPDADPTVCQELPSEWRAECHFRIAERLGVAGDRWEALVECGLSGRYYDECLYHLWSRELQAASEPSADAPSRALDHVDAARPIVAYWAGTRNTQQEARELIWDDFWYFAHARNRPADFLACEELEALDRTRCERGTERFAQRLVAETLIRPSTEASVRSRACRSQVVPAWITDGAWLEHERMEQAARNGLEDACQDPPHRPWNPVFVSTEAP
ncbi:MAG: hypothetical protein GY913_26225 [Proteobacteria bacterium]|nr:hypothetical protein [Pseudomonadota bacterium]MCP4920414.1 hypothetical protein [Pseudomonadota bacterium]